MVANNFFAKYMYMIMSRYIHILKGYNYVHVHYMRSEFHSNGTTESQVFDKPQHAHTMRSNSRTSSPDFVVK